MLEQNMTMPATDYLNYHIRLVNELLNDKIKTHEEVQELLDLRNNFLKTANENFEAFIKGLYELSQKRIK